MEEYLTWKEVVDGNGNKVRWYLTENKRSLSEALKKKHFENDFRMIRYLSAIVRNNVAQYRSNEYMSLPLSESELQVKENTAIIPNSKRRKSLAELEDEA